ncbi:hypothetical protein N7481_000751 [Penicillium waksmanii]|uniref:uncharacterized protein n=1 Tax=Penicillium waksmanii TaxID=69791 RepID=UPI002547BDB1|nr:uncharacterized protein N7481_000751 [Penicillium waksmanii]KAJ6000342.1 hypothetical protein N7481_000751 [Penicillium waksmanii]
MEKVRKTFFNPLATSKAKVVEILEALPVGSAHPFSPEQILLCRTEDGITEIDISSYPEDFFFNAVDLGEMGEVLLRRMTKFNIFKDFQIMQAPDTTFKIPIVSDQITILAVSERTPTYWDFCFADEDCNACCWLERKTFSGITHSGDILQGKDLLDFVWINKDSLTEKEICVFISGYVNTRISRFMGTYPAMLVADHMDKILYIIPVPLDAATIGDATICCPLVVKRDEDSLICSILPTATTDRDMHCHSKRLDSPAFPEAIKRANFTISAKEPTKRCEHDMEETTRTSKRRKLTETDPLDDLADADAATTSRNIENIVNHRNAVFTTYSATIPSFLDQGEAQVIRFGTGLEFESSSNEILRQAKSSGVVLPCIFGSELQGPTLLATGTAPFNVPFFNENSLRGYYKKLKSAVVILIPETEPKNPDAVLSLMNSANINAVTALAGPQSLVLVQICEKLYFYRGIANLAHLDTSGLEFGTDLTSLLHTVGMESILDPRIPRIVRLDKENSILLPASGQFVQPQALQNLLEEISIEQIQKLEQDISAAVPQLQMLLNQKDLQELSKSLVATLSAKVSNVAAPLRDRYTRFLTAEYNVDDRGSVLMKNNLLGELRKVTKDMQKTLEPIISCLANMISSQTTSKRTHDLKRLVRQTTIQNNVEAAKSMTFDALSGYLEEYAEDMGVMLLNIDTETFRELLGNLKNNLIDASPCCALDSRILHLQGFDAGILIEQSQSKHDGPLRSIAGASQPILALPYLSQLSGRGSMLAWVCWDEFVNLKSPYKVRWMEKCNEPHIAALRIIIRNTLSQAVASREYNLQPGSNETGALMSALLMASMSKLAAMRTSKPTEIVGKAEDTVTRLMRGLFGNLLTIAGSGLRPLSMVWQLFGQHPQYDVPATRGDWVWYETVVKLYPYTGWPLAQFHSNLEKLLDKAVIRVVTKNENIAQIKASRTEEMTKFCKLRNIHLAHCRTILTVFMRMLTANINNGTEIDIAAVATRLLAHIPPTLEKEVESYRRMIFYLTHLAEGKPRIAECDSIPMNLYTRRSGAFAELKLQVREACKEKNWEQVKKSCQDIQTKKNEIATLWNVAPDSVKVHNIKAYKALLAADFSENIDQEIARANQKIAAQIAGDAEIELVPWRVGKKGQYGDIEPLDESVVHEILTGKADSRGQEHGGEANEVTEMTAEKKVVKLGDEFVRFEKSFTADFIQIMQQEFSIEAVCEVMMVPVSAMRVFVDALNPEFDWGKFGVNFQGVILDLMRNRSGREDSRPVRKLLLLEKGLLLAD